MKKITLKSSDGHEIPALDVNINELGEAYRAIQPSSTFYGWLHELTAANIITERQGTNGFRFYVTDICGVLLSGKSEAEQ